MMMLMLLLQLLRMRRMMAASWIVKRGGRTSWRHHVVDVRRRRRRRRSASSPVCTRRKEASISPVSRSRAGVPFFPSLPLVSASLTSASREHQVSSKRVPRWWLRAGPLECGDCLSKRPLLNCRSSRLVTHDLTRNHPTKKACNVCLSIQFFLVLKDKTMSANGLPPKVWFLRCEPTVR